MRSLLGLSFGIVALASVLSACAGTGTSSTSGGPAAGAGGAGTSGGNTDPGAGGGNWILFGSGGGGGGGGAAAGGGCEPPDVLIALDRTLTMMMKPSGAKPTDAPAYASSKWSQAIAAIHALVAPPADGGVRFGLELWPKQEHGCLTLAQSVHGFPTNPFCEDGEVLVSPDLGTGAQISALLDPATTKICISTPTGAGLLTGASHLQGIKKEGRDQYILLVTDGADWDQSCPDPDPVSVTQQLAASGIKTFVVGFSASGDLMSGGVGAPFLNDMACAGRTAEDFATSCRMGPNGYVAVDAHGPTLYLQSSDGASLSAALAGVAGSLCCDCLR